MSAIVKRSLSRIPLIAVLTLIGVVSFAGIASAADQVAAPDQSLLDLAKPVFDAVMHSNWWLAASLSVVLMVAAARRYLPDSWGGKFARGDVGGMIAAFLVSFAGAVGTAAAAKGTVFVMSGALALTALKVGLGAIGGFVALHKLATWLVATKWYQDHVPGPIKSVIGLALSIIGSSAIEKAEKAGQDAVAAHPAQGAEAVLGAPTEIK